MVGLGGEWDLHNIGIFRGYEFNVDARTVTFKWSLDYSGSPWAPPNGQPYPRICSLVFHNHSLLLVVTPDKNILVGDDTCVVGISKVAPFDYSHPILWQYRVKEQWGETEPFHLLIALQSGRSIEVGAEDVELHIQ